jgi:ribosome-interacting GTPase 1
MVDLSRESVWQVEAVKQELEKMRIKVGAGPAEMDAESSVWYKKAVLAGNKSDLDENGLNYRALQAAYAGQYPVISISAAGKAGLEELKRSIFEALGIVRIYTKTPGQKADMQEPFVLPCGSTLADAAASVHKDLANHLKFARLWGSGKHEGMMVKRDHVLADGDVIELHG